MKIAGFQKLTLLDFPGKTACTVFTMGCNFLCPFCHNAGLLSPKKEDVFISEDEVFSYLSKRRGVLDGVVLTGGEPLLQPDAAEFLQKVKDLGFLTKLDTNGTRPEALKRLLEAGLLDYVAMDVKNSPALYGVTVGVPTFDTAPIYRSRDLLMESGVDFEFRTTLVKGLHTEESVKALAKSIEGDEKFFLQQYKDSGNVLAPAGLSEFSPEEMKKFADLCRPFTRAVQVRGI